MKKESATTTGRRAQPRSFNSSVTTKVRETSVRTTTPLGCGSCKIERKAAAGKRG